jgi:small GTP-binding protein
MSTEVDYTLKILLAGDSRVGKTSFINVIQKNDHFFSTSTIGVDFTTLYYTLHDRNIKVNIWDTSGKTRFHSIIRTYFRDICAIVLMFDVTKPDSFSHLDDWLNLLLYETKCHHTHPILLLGNKNDMVNRIDNVKLNEFIDTYNVTYREISCKQDSHLEEIFTSFISKIITNDPDDDCHGIKTLNESSSSASSPTLTTSLLQNQKPKKKSNCCNIF